MEHMIKITGVDLKKLENGEMHTLMYLIHDKENLDRSLFND